MNVVLIVEDEPLILMAIADHLIDEGFRVIEARHAEEALAILTAHAPEIHMLFTDVQMPGDMDGVALSHYAKTHWPWIGLLVTSAHMTPQADNLPAGCRFIRKPYDHAQVALHVKELQGAPSRIQW